MCSTIGFALCPVLHECDGAVAERFRAAILRRVTEPPTRLFHEAVRCGIERGDARPDTTGGLVFDAPPV